ncbi:MAG: DNA polymerase III subunit delta [Acidobacteriia bacterium]|nr:DNA polymerase III subunit delta [Methyloceanibacter sp.]MCL6491780.1 DNA polymerase III subunit delta [Terriglobia bacterium]
MKIDPRKVEETLSAPEKFRLILLYGDDLGLIRERAERVSMAVVGAREDPFRIAEIAAGQFGEIPAEMAALSLTGGRRVVRVREASDAATSAVQEALAGPGEALLLLEAPGLAARSRLRALAERAADAAAIGCYQETGRALMQTISAVLNEFGVTATEEARAWLASHLGADHAATRRELEKLALFANRGETIDIAAAEACVGDFAGLSLEDALFAATCGDLAETDRALELALAEGSSPVSVVRAALSHLQRLLAIKLAVAEGASETEAMNALRPPVFFRRQAAFRQALSLWSQAMLETAAQGLWEAERACKQTGQPAELICRRAILALAQRAAQAKQRR